MPEETDKNCHPDAGAEAGGEVADAVVPQNTEQSRNLNPAFVAQMWKPGQSGNPGGRPKKKLVDQALTELLEAKDSEEAIAIAVKLIQMARGGDSQSAKLIAERTEGKPLQKVEHSGADGGPIEASLLVKFVDAQ